MINTKKKYAAIAAILTLLFVGTGSTSGYLEAKTEDVKNTMNPAQVSCLVEETFDDNVKSQVSIKNTSDIKAYIRAKVVINLVNTQGEILAEEPKEGREYHIVYSEGTGWIRGDDGYCYYTTPVAPGENTGELIKQCVQDLNHIKRGTNLTVEVIAGAVQYLPEEAVSEAWGVTVDGGTIVTAKKESGGGL